MEQNTLYRKYRPLDFDAVVGQDAIVRTLKNQIQNNRVAHAYLFCGERGTADQRSDVHHHRGTGSFRTQLQLPEARQYQHR